MKKLLLPILLMTNVFASQSFERVIKDATHKSTVTLNKKTVRCSALGYGLQELKISVPSLQWHAVLDHSNQDGRGPCVTAGSKFCGFGLPIFNEDGTIQDGPSNGIPDILLDLDNPTAQVDVRVILKETFFINREGTECHRGLKEEVEMDVRGIDFSHLRSKSIGTLPVEECLAIKANL
jgi:hypothetical protein